MKRYLNKVHTIESTEFHVKAADKLSPVDITLHPIYRSDGLMLVNRYTTLMPTVLKQIQRHISEEMPIPIVVASSEAQLENFLSKQIYSKPEFVLLLDNILRASIHCYNVPVSIEAYVDERVDIATSIKEISRLRAMEVEKTNEESYESEEKNEIQIEIKGQKISSILSKMTSSKTIWKDFENRLIQIDQQSRVKELKDRLFNYLQSDKTLVDLIYKMDFFDERLLIHGTNTACLSILFGIISGVSDEDVLNLAIAGLFCNIGFIKMDKEVVNNFLNGNIDEAVVSEHIRKSLEVISTSSICRNKAIIFGILEHHEFFNGSGLPSRRKGKELSLFGRILSISLKYETYIDKLYQGNISNMLNIEKMICRNNENKYDQDILNLYLRKTNMSVMY